MDRKFKVLEAELQAISGATDTMYDLLKIVNNMASSKVKSCKCIPKSKANEKLEAYIQTTKILADIKSRIVADSVTLESFLISIGYIESEDDDEESESSTEKNISTISQPSLISGIPSSICESQSSISQSISNKAADLRADCNVNSIRFDSIPSTTNVESLSSVSPIYLQTAAPDVTNENVTTDVFTADFMPEYSRPPHNQSEISRDIKDDVSPQTQADCSTNSNTNRHIAIDADELLKKRKVLSLEDRYVNSLLEKSNAPDLRLQRSPSSSSSSSLLSTKSSYKTKASKNSKSRKVNKTFSINGVKTDGKASSRISSMKTIKTNFSQWSEAGDNVMVKPIALVARSSSSTSFSILSENTLNREFLASCLPRVEQSCTISSLKNPQSLYIQLLDQISALLTLNENLNATYEHSTVHYTNKSDAKEKIGDNCVTYVDDYCAWHRVQVIDWQLMSHTNTVLVFLVDYGDTLKVPVENLRKLMSEFFNDPTYGIHCTLEGLHPPSSTDTVINTIWTTAELNDFYEFMQKGNQVEYRLTYVNTESKPIGIDIADSEDTNPENSLGQELINANIVKQILSNEVKLIPDHSIMIDQIKSVQGLLGTNSNMTEIERLEKYLQNDMYNEPTNIVEAVTGYDVNDERRVCRFATKDGTCFKGLHCKLEHTQLRPDGFTTDKNFVFCKALHTYILPSVDEEIKIFITCFTRPNEFYGHILERNEPQIYGTSLQQLAFDLKNPQAVKRFQRLQLQPTIGQIVLAKNWDDTWCRARIIEIDGLTVDLFIVDYGESVTVSMEDLREISADYLILPFQAVKFCLWDLEKPADITDEEVINYMESHYLCEEFTATVRSRHPHLYVDVHNQTYEDVCTDLINRGFGARTFEQDFVKSPETSRGVDIGTHILWKIY